MAHTTFRMTALALVGLGIWVGNVRADKAQLEDRLKQDLQIQLENVTIGQALEQIGEKGWVKIVLSPGAIWKLPEGRDTRVSVALEGRLSESLEKMLNNFFLRYAVGSETLTIYPRPELKHIIGRPTADELKLLKRIYEGKAWIAIPAERGDLPDRFVQAAVKMFAGESIAVMPSEVVPMIGRVMQKMGGKTSPPGSTHDPNSNRGEPLTLALILEGVGQSSPYAAWYIRGPEFPRQMSEIRIVTREEFWQAHLDQIMDVSFSHETGEAVIGTLAAWGDLTVQFPGGEVPPGLAQRITLEVQNTKLFDVLQRAASVLGIYQTLNLSTGVVELRSPPPRIGAAPAKPAAKEVAPQVPSETPSGGYVGKISIPMDGGRYFIEFMLRESDLTDELRQLRQQRIRQILEDLSKTTPAEKK
jgi:hypothetical protein